MAQITKTFYDVEHEGDISEIYDVITKNGGHITHRDFDYEGERLSLTFDVPDADKFFEAVKDEYFF